MSGVTDDSSIVFKWSKTRKGFMCPFGHRVEPGSEYLFDIAERRKFCDEIERRRFYAARDLGLSDDLDRVTHAIGIHEGTVAVIVENGQAYAMLSIFDGIGIETNHRPVSVTVNGIRVCDHERHTRKVALHDGDNKVVDELGNEHVITI